MTLMMYMLESLTASAFGFTFGLIASGILRDAV